MITIIRFALVLMTLVVVSSCTTDEAESPDASTETIATLDRMESVIATGGGAVDMAQLTKELDELFGKGEVVPLQLAIGADGAEATIATIKQQASTKNKFIYPQIIRISLHENGDAIEALIYRGDVDVALDVFGE